MVFTLYDSRVKFYDIIDDMIYVMSILDFLFLQHPLFSVIAIGSILFVAKVEGAYEMLAIAVLFVVAIHHDKLGSKKK